MYALKDPIGDTIPARRPALAILSHAAEVPAPDLAVARARRDVARRPRGPADWLRSELRSVARTN